MGALGITGSNIDLLTGLRALQEATGGGSPNVTVAVIDGPVDFTHEVLWVPTFGRPLVRCLCRPMPETKWQSMAPTLPAFSLANPGPR